MKALRLLTPLALLSACGLLLGCAKDSEEKPTEKAKGPKPELVGRVASIPSTREFVLIQSYGSWNVQAGAILTTTGPEGRAANLKVTGEKLGQFAAADIQSGTLEIGDGVYSSVATPKPSSSPSSTEPEPDEPTEVEPESDRDDNPDGSDPQPPLSGTDTLSFPN